MAFEELLDKDTIRFDTARLEELKSELSYQDPFYVKGIRSFGRIPLRVFDDTMNSMSDLTGGAWGRTKIEQETFGKAEGAENVTSEIGSALLGFFTVGTKAAQGLAVGAKGISKGSQKLGLNFNKGVSKKIKEIEYTQLGEKSKWAINLAKDGALRGAVVDFMIADTTEEQSILERMKKRSEDVLLGALVGSGLNVTFGLLGSKAWNQMRNFMGKQAVELKKSHTKIAKLAEKGDEALSEFTATEEGQVELINFVANAAKVSETLNPSGSVTFKEIIDEAPNVDYIYEKDEILKEVIDPKIKDADKLEESIIDQFNKMKDLPSALQKSNLFVLHSEQQLTPRINELYYKLKKLFDKPSLDMYTALRDDVENFKSVLKTYRLAVQVRAKAGTLAGKALAALRKTSRFKGVDASIHLDPASSRGNFNKTVDYSDEVLDKFNKIDALLSTVESIKRTDPDDLHSFILNRNPKQKEILEAIGEGTESPSEILTKMVMGSGYRNKNRIWDKYKTSLINSVKNLLKNKDPKQKAPLAVLQTSLLGRISKEIKKGHKKGKTTKKLQTLKSKLTNLDNWEQNKDEVKEILSELKSKNIIEISYDDIVSEDSDTIVKALIKLDNAKGGDDATSFLNSLDISDELRERIRLDLEDAKLAHIEEMKEEELLQEALRQRQKETTLKELNELFVSGDPDKIKAFFENALNQTKNADELTKLINKRKAQLKKKYQDQKVTPDQIAAIALNDLQGLVSKVNKELSSKSQKFWQGFDRFRMGMMMFHPKTWLIGPVSGLFHLVEQPIKQAIKSLSHIKQLKKLTPEDQNLQNVDEFQYAWSQISTAINLGTMWDSIKNGVSTFMKDKSAFNPRIQNRFEQEFMKVGEDINVEKLAGLNTYQQKQLSDLISQYGSDTAVNRQKLKNFYATLESGKSGNAVGKALELFSSISFRAMGGVDDVFRTYGTMRALRAEAMQKALIAGKTTKEEIKTFSEDYMKKAVLKDSTSTAKEVYGFGGDKPVSTLRWKMDEEFSDVEQLGLAITYQADFADRVFSRTMKSIANWSRDYSNDDYAKRFTRIVLLPFVKTPTAIGQWMLDHGFGATGLYRRLTADSKLSKQRKALTDRIDSQNKLKEAGTVNEIDANQIIEEAQKSLRNLDLQAAQMKADATADIISGLFWTGILGSLAASSKITGSGSHMSPQDRKAAEEGGWKPNRLNIGNISVSYERVEPISSFLSLASDAVAHMYAKDQFKSAAYKDEDAVNLLTTVAVGMSEMMRNKFFLRSLSDVISVFDTSGDKISFNASNWATGFTASLTPRIIKDLNEIAEPYEKRSKDFLDKLKQRVYGGSTAGYNRNLFGEKITRRRSKEGFIGLVSPIYISQKQNDPLLQQLSYMQHNFGQHTRYIRSFEGVKYDTRDFKNNEGKDLYDAWLEHLERYKIKGNTLRKRLSLDLRSNKYKRLPIKSEQGDSVSNLINDTINTYEKESFKEFINKHGKRFVDSNGVRFIDQKQDNVLKTLLKLNR